MYDNYITAHLFEGSRSYVLSIYIMGSSIVPLPVTITPVESGRYHCLEMSKRSILDVVRELISNLFLLAKIILEGRR
jgi:hypothetical protein